MPLSQIVIVVLRLFAIQTFVSSLSYLVWIPLTLEWKGHFLLQLVIPALFLLAAFIEWILAPAIARIVTQGQNVELNIAGLTREDLYSFAFVFLGLYFILTSIASSISWIHYLLSARGLGRDIQPGRTLYDLASSLLTLVAGILCFLPANRWARALIKRERQPIL